MNSDSVKSVLYGIVAVFAIIWISASINGLNVWEILRAIPHILVVVGKQMIESIQLPG